MNSKQIQTQLKLIKRGTSEIIQEAELIKKLDRSQRESRPLKIKMGFDPTAPDLHLGHSLGLKKMRDFQELGHEVYFLIGDFTGRIGDPSGRNKTRPPLSDEEIELNAQTYKDQVFKILDPQKTKVVFNSEWCQKLKPEEIIQLASQMNVARMLEREDFKNRYQSGQSISIHEFLYPLIQGYDSVALQADIEIGGQDQRFNLLVGRDLQKSAGMEEQVLIFLPLLEGTDGAQKMSKSYGNAIGIQENSKEMFGKLMSIPDSLMERYFEFLTRVPLDEARHLIKEKPRDAKVLLAKTIVEEFHSKPIAEQEEQNFVNQFSKKEIPSDEEISDCLEIKDDDEAFYKALVRLKKIPSNAEARRLFESSACRSSLPPQGSRNADQKSDKLYILSLEDLNRNIPDNAKIKIGKKTWLRIKKGGG